MKGSWARVARASRTTGLAHLLKTGAALGLAYPVARELTTPLNNAFFAEQLGPADAAVILEAVAMLPDGLAHLLPTSLVILGGYLMLQPLMSLMWLRSLMEGDSPGPHLRRGAAAYPQAVLVSLSCLLALIATLALLGLAAYSLHQSLSFTHDMRLRDLAALALVLACAPLASLTLACLHDTARAALVAGETGTRAALRRGVSALCVGAFTERLLLAAATATLFTIGVSCAQAMSGSAPAVASLALQQSLALAMTLLRARWLASVVDRVQSPP